jgi:cellulose synthase/poly-beta-1,6-N-acetylglucosamine synthase-like glycosyltransferase
MMALEITVWVCLALVAYAYAGYPLVVCALARLFGSSRRPPNVPGEELPSATLLIAAFNEESVLAERIQNALAMEYSPGKLEILIASDGSADRTCEIARRYASDWSPHAVRLLDFRQRRGKASVLNDAMTHARGQIVLLSDANTFYQPDAAVRLARWFADAGIAAVCGKLVLTDPRQGRNVDSLYWRYETFLKQCEGRLGALLGANGAIYAIRKDQFVPIPPNTIIDDFVIPLLIQLRHGGRIVYDAEAVAWEESPAHISSEFRRRSRIGAGGFQSLFLLWRLLVPTRGWISFTFWSHKVLRWLCPFFLVAALVANALLLADAGYQVLFALQLAFYALSAAGAFWPGQSRVARAVRLCTMFTSMNLALLAGCWRWLRGIRGGTWHRTARQPA